jgi:hypothetical protein
MAEPVTHIDVKVTVESIRDSLRKRIVSENSKLLTDVIIGNLNTSEVGMTQLFKALSGIEDTIPYKVGDFLMVKISPLYGWKFDKEKTKEAGLIIQDRIRAQLVCINRYKETPLEVIYAVKDSEGDDINVTSPVRITDACLEDEWPGEFEKDLHF